MYIWYSISNKQKNNYTEVHLTHINYTIEFTECKKNSHLSLHEMSLIEAWKLDGHSNREIARRLNRAPQTINNAKKRHSKAKESNKK